MEIRKMRMLTAASLACGSLLVMAVAAQAGTFAVNSTTDAPATATALSQGVCADVSGACTLRAAVQVADLAPGASTITVPAGTYSLTVTGADETYAPAPGTGVYVVQHTPDPSIGDLNITRSVAIVGAGPDQTLIGWGVPQGDRIFHVEPVDQNISVTFSGLTVQGGDVGNPVVLDDSDPNAIVQFVRFGGGLAIGPGAAIAIVNPNAEHGGGSDEGGGGGDEGEESFSVNNVTLDNVHVLNNYSGGDGGGVYNTAPLTVTDSIISGNISAAGNGGGIYSDGALTMTGTTVGTVGPFTIGNQGENGGGIFETGSHTSHIDKSAIVGNSGVGGGGIAARVLVQDRITNTTIAKNLAQDTGGGIITNGQVTLINATVADNQVTSDSEGGGAGLSSFPASGGNASYTMANTIIANNTLATVPPTVANCGGVGQAPTFTSHGYNLEDANTCNLSGTNDLINTNPLLEPLADNGGLTETMALASTLTTPAASASSPAIDAGNNANCPNNDQRDSLRPADGNLDGNFVCDIGAYELYIPAADLHINNMTAPDEVFVTDEFRVAVEVHIDPNATANSQGVQITTDPLPADLVPASASIITPAGTSACTIASGVVTCDAGTLAPDQAATAVLKLTAQNPAAALTVTAHVSQTSPTDPNPGNNSASVNVEAVGLSNLAVSASTAPVPAVALGTDTTIPFALTNAGPFAASQLRVGIELPPQLAYRSVTLTNGTCDASDPTAILCTVNALGVGGGLSGELTVSGALAGTGAVEITVSARERDDDVSDNQVNVPRTVARISDLALSGGFSNSRMNPGGQAALALTLRNGGPSDATNAVITLQLPTGLAFQSASGGVSCAGSGTVTCTIGSLASGQSVQLTVNLTSTGPTGSLNVISTAVSDGTDPDTSNNTVTSSLTVEVSGGGGGAFMPFGLAALAFIGLLAGLARRRKVGRLH